MLEAPGTLVLSPINNISLFISSSKLSRATAHQLRPSSIYCCSLGSVIKNSGHQQSNKMPPRHSKRRLSPDQDESQDPEFTPSPSPSTSASQSPSASLVEPSRPKAHSKSNTTSTSTTKKSASTSTNKPASTRSTSPTTFPSLPTPLPTTPLNPLSYPYTPTEKLVLTLEPYKSALLPYWRFKTVSLAKESSAHLFRAFQQYEAQDDFPGMDMARKFIQMGMTRAKRYANWQGGRKYVSPRDGGGEGAGVLREGGPGGGGGDWEGRSEKEEASLVFRKCWERVKGYEGYASRKEVWLEEGRRLRAEEREGSKGLRKGKGEVGKEVVKARRGRKMTKRKEAGS